MYYQINVKIFPEFFFESRNGRTDRLCVSGPGRVGFGNYPGMILLCLYQKSNLSTCYSTGNPYAVPVCRRAPIAAPVHSLPSLMLPGVGSAVYV